MRIIDDPGRTLCRANLHHRTNAPRQCKHGSWLAVWPHKSVPNLDIFDDFQAAISHKNLLACTMTAGGQTHHLAPDPTQGRGFDGREGVLLIGAELNLALRGEGRHGRSSSGAV